MMVPAKTFLLSLIIHTVVLASAPGAFAAENDERRVAISVNEAANEDYDVAINVARRAGMQSTELSIFWDDFETNAGSYAPEMNWLQIANLYYPAVNIPVSLTISVIDTVTKRVPADLAGTAFDDPALILRFKQFLDYSFSQIPRLKLSAIAIGNEVDGWLGNNNARWQQYERFYREIADYIHRKRPGLPVGVKIMYGGISGYARSRAMSLNRYSDLVLVTYYPLDEGFHVQAPEIIGSVFDTITAIYPEKTINFAELGYPSSEACGGSEAGQAEFVRQAFRAWDRHRRQIKTINFVWLTDIPDASVAEYGRYYGVDNRCFSAYLASLGLRRANGDPKPAYRQLMREVKKRSWN